MQCKRIIPLVLVSMWLVACGISAPAVTVVPSLRPAKTAMATSTSPTLPTEAIPTFVQALKMPDLEIARHPDAIDFSYKNLRHLTIPKYDPNITSPFQIDYRSMDLTKLDLSKSKADLLYADFDSQTIWPPADQMPTGFDWQKIMEMGKNPGLGVQELHKKGITGKGIGIAIIDQPLLVDHIEYKDQLRIYEETEDRIKMVAKGDTQASLHGTAVASIAVGRTVGVAPDADLYFIAFGDCGGNPATLTDFDFSCDAKDIQRVIEINKSLPADRKIRAISLQFGWRSESKGYQEITTAVEQAKAAGIFVISTYMLDTYGFQFNGLGRDPLAGPDEFKSYQPGLLWSKDFYAGQALQRQLLIPMDARTTASPTGTEDYAHYVSGGLSWAVPYLAGMYALAIQVKPDVTPEEFWKLALETGKTTQIQHDGKSYSLGIILDPQALMAALQK
jgi:hypothetical protein